MPSLQTQESDTPDESSSLVSIDEGMRLSDAKNIGGSTFKCVSILILPIIYRSM